MQQITSLRSKIERFNEVKGMLEDCETYYEMAKESSDDEELWQETADSLNPMMKELQAFELETLLNGEYDANNAIISIHPGAGGTEGQDWAEMLYRMYVHWAENHHYGVTVLDYLAGEEAGIKSVTLLIKGENAFGYLKAERGVHRLVRISPFDASGRRHTSFAALEVMPEVEHDDSIEIDPKDLRIDTYRSTGAGGQHINTTDSAVRITHIPTGVVVQCQNERSQHHNKDSAMRILRGRLYDLELSKRDAARQAEYAGKNAISFGSQIRTYTLQPYRLVKDHRNNCEIGDTDAVLDGRIDKLLRDYLLWQHTNRQQQQQ